MTKNILKRILSVTMAAALILSISACGKKKEDELQQKTDTKEMVYEGTELALEGVEGDVSSFFIQNEKLYILTAKKTVKEGNSAMDDEAEKDSDADKKQSTESAEEDKDKIESEKDSEKDNEGVPEKIGDETSGETTIARMYVADMDGSNVKEISVPEMEKNEYINTYFVDSYGNIIYLLNHYDQNLQKSSWYVVKTDKQGKEVMRGDVTGSLKLTEGNYISKVIQDDEGRIIIVADQTIYVLDENLKLFCEIKSDNHIDGGARTKDGTIICGYSNEDGAQIQVLDIEQKKWGKSYSLDLQYFRSPDWIIDGLEYDFYYKDDSGIYGYDMRTEKGTKLMDYFASDFEPDKIFNIIPLGKDKFLGRISENDKTKLIVYLKADSSSIADKQIITLGAMYMDDFIKTAVIMFNRENKEYRIEIKDFSEEEEPWAKMNMDILAGNVPDIICLNNLPSDQYAAKGILEDLTPYFDKDPEINTSDILTSVLEAAKIDDKLYYVFPSFNVCTVIGSTKEVGTESGWTFEDLKALLDEKGGNTRPFFSEGKSEMLFSFLTNGISDFVDWQTGSCTFDSQEFKEILELCNRGKDDEEKGYGEDGPSLPSLIKEEKVLFAEGPVTLEKIQFYKKIFNGNITFIGYPNKEKEGSYFTFSHCLGIYSKSKVKEGAWEFLRMFMTKEYQSQNDLILDMPARKDCFDMIMKEKTTTKTYTDEFGREIHPVESSWEYDGFEVEIKPSTPEEAAQFKELINNTKRIGGNDSDIIIKIIAEEAEAYFKGDKSLDDVANVIQNRVKTYVNESR